MRFIYLIFMIAASACAEATPPLSRVTLTLTNPANTISHTMHGELADTETARATGLMHRTSLCATCGMWFVYPELAQTPDTILMWMRNTLIPLDMVFVKHGVVVGVHAHAQPLDERIISSPGEVTNVLEVNGGWAQQHGVKAGWMVSVSMPLPISRTSATVEVR